MTYKSLKKEVQLLSLQKKLQQEAIKMITFSEKNKKSKMKKKVKIKIK